MTRIFMTAFDYIRTIIVQHRHRQSLPDPYLDELGGLSLPGMIRGPSGREILFDSEMLATVRDLADCLGKDDRSVGNREWLNLVRQSVAYALDACAPSTDLDVMADDVLKAVRSSLSLSKSKTGHFEFAFGCTLFEGVIPRPFCIGPVRFETRQDWLERKFAEGAISSLTRRRVLRAWEGQTPRKRKGSVDSHQEETILSLTSEASFVCSVNTNGMTHEFGQRLARTTARLALTAIALLWEQTSQVLSKMNLVEDRVVRILHELTFQDGPVASCGSRKSHAPGGQRLNANEWDKLQRDFDGYFSVIDELLKSIADISSPPSRPKTTHALAHALLWFHQACREEEEVIAVVNFATALDCLASGENRQGITALIEAQLGVGADNALWVRGNQTTKEAVDKIYDHARNAMLHGRKGKNGRPDSKPFHDWEPERERAETLARYCLLACINWTARHPSSDAPESWRRCSQSDS
jgi:hypothetical protein